jgi:hypothetical protein
VLESPVAGNDRRAALIALADDLEEAIGAELIDRQIPQFVDLCGAPHKSTNVESSVMWSATAILLFS